MSWKNFVSENHNLRVQEAHGARPNNGWFE